MLRATTAHGIIFPTNIPTSSAWHRDLNRPWNTVVVIMSAAVINFSKIQVRVAASRVIPVFQHVAYFYTLAKLLRGKANNKVKLVYISTWIKLNISLLLFHNMFFLIRISKLLGCKCAGVVSSISRYERGGYYSWIEKVRDVLVWMPYEPSKQNVNIVCILFIRLHGNSQYNHSRVRPWDYNRI